uniref:F-box associated beta-propeller type 3 domain-containing protein n=1 Tax=Rhizophora mucronata TaxID=61149 RepID=A0A2P2Q2Z8_RHIMU
MLERVCLESTVPVGQEFKLIGCSNGLLLFGAFSRWKQVFFVCNPFKPGQFILRQPDKPGYLCGIYFHPLTKDYRVLYVSEINNDTEYLVLSLHTLQWRKLCYFAHWPKQKVAPISIGGLVHWMVEHKPVIMTFTIKTEEFNARPHPGTMCHLHPMPDMQLLQMGSCLAFCNLCCGKIGIWVLEDYINWVWVSRYVVDLEWDLKCYPFAPGNEINNDIKLVTIENGDLVLFWAYRGLFRYNLQLKTIRKIPIGVSKLDIQSTNSLLMTSYTKSFVTLRLRNFASFHDIERFRKI